MTPEGIYIDVDLYAKSKIANFNGTIVYSFIYDLIHDKTEYVVLCNPDKKVNLIRNKVYKVIKNKSNSPLITIINEKGIKAQYPKYYFISLPKDYQRFIDKEKTRLEKLKKLENE